MRLFARSGIITSSIITTTIISVIFSTSLLAHATQTGWYKLTDSEAGFAISFPAKPVYEQVRNPTTDEPMENYTYNVNQHQLMITIQHLSNPPRTASELRELLNGSAQLYASGDTVLLRQEKLPGGGRQYDNVRRTSEGTLYMRSRLYIRNGTLYMLSYGTFAPGGIDEDAAGLFLDSFSFTGNTRRKGTVKKRRARPKALPLPIKPTDMM
jgi:hypothetical protein